MTAMDVLDAKALRIFMAVARIGSIRGAAEHMGLAPSVVSRQIADTERDIGLSLFERTARGTVLTDAGELVLEHGKRVLEDNGLLAEQLDQIRGVQQTRIRIRCGEGFMADLVENGLSSFAKAHSYVRYIVELGSTEDVVDAIANSDADIGIAYTPFFPLGGFSPLQSARLNDIAASLGATPMQVALAWLLQRSPNILLIPGTSSLGHLKENLEAANLRLSAETVAALDAIGGRQAR